MKISVVIVNYNVKYYVGQCIDSVRRALRGIDSEIIVVDNHSLLGLVEMGIARNCSGSMSADRNNYFLGNTDFWMKEWYIVKRVRI